MVEISVLQGDALIHPCDLLILKYADKLHGLDELVAERIGFDIHLHEDERRWVAGENLGARSVLYIGVGPLRQFRYEKIRRFAAEALHTAAEIDPRMRVICSPVHGPGYGLDEREAFFSLVGGFLDTVEAGKFPPALEKICIIEQNSARAERLKELLAETLGK